MPAATWLRACGSIVSMAIWVSRRRLASSATRTR